jgi:hypothetical protein
MVNFSMRVRRSWRAFTALVVLLASPWVVRADDTAAALAKTALAACEEGRRAEARVVRQSAFERGQALAERAVALDDSSAPAHFALFCNMGELMRLDGESLSSVLALRKLMAEVDRTLELDPRHHDAMAAKGTLLVRLPRMLGGDGTKGEQLLRQAIVLDPNAFSCRLVLAKHIDARGERAEAVAFATRALQIAREQGRADKIAQAQSTLAELHASE